MSLRFYVLCPKSFRLYAQYFIIFLYHTPKFLQIQRSVVSTIVKTFSVSIIEPSNLFHDVWFDILYSMESALSILGFLKILKSSKHHVQIGAPIELSLIYSSADSSLTILPGYNPFNLWDFSFSLIYFS